MPTKYLTDPFIRSQKSLTKSRVEYYDTKVSGLILRITKNGTKTFSFRKRINGRYFRYTIGKFPTIGLAKARSIARDLAVKVSRNEDPQRVKVEKRQDLTVRELCEIYKKKHFPKLKESTRKDYKNRIDTVIVPSIGTILAKDLNSNDILELLEYLHDERDSPIQSNRVRAILSSIYSFAQNYRYVDLNPVLAIRPLGKEIQRDRFYSEDELRSIWRLINEIDQPVRSLFKFLIITGQRLGETRKMEWAHIDNSVWFLPKENTKAKRDHTVPLPSIALNQLEELKVITGASRYVFESPAKAGQPIYSVKWHAKNIRDHKDGVADFRVHDVRRTVASNLARLKVNRTVIGKLLNHKQLAGDNHVTARYDRYDYMEEKKKAIQLWSQKLVQIVTPQAKRETGTARIYRIT